LGAVYVLSGAALNGPPLVRVTAFLGEAGFGWSVAALGDASGDGSADFVAGNWSTRAGCCFFYPGSARVHSGVDGAFVQSGGYGSNGRLGRAGDWNDDGLQDYLVQLDSDYQTGSFQARIVAGRPPLPMPNPDCAGTPNGCQPMIFTTSTPSPQATTPFGIHATGFEAGVQGFLLLGTGERAVPFGAGQLCVARPFARYLAQMRELEATPWCPIAQSYEFQPGQLGQGPLAPGETFFGQFFALGPAGLGALETSGSIRVQVWP
jgi:hypothetical protein